METSVKQKNMGANSELFLQLQAEQFPLLFAQDFTKKEAQQTGKKLVEDLIDNGSVDKMMFAANLARLNEVISTAMEEIRKHLPMDKQSVIGVEFTPRNGGDTINFKDDLIWMGLQKQLKDREELLKVAIKTDSEFYDSEGILVPKCSKSPRKSSLSITF